MPRNAENCRCRSNTLDLLVLGGQCDTGCGVPCATLDMESNGEDGRGTAVARRLTRWRECLVHTGHHDECVESTEDQTAERARNSVEAGHTFTQPKVLGWSIGGPTR